MKKATLYYPLFLVCRGIIEVITDYQMLGNDRSRNIFTSSTKALDSIVYEYGSIIHLKKADDISAFFSMKKAIDEHIEFIEKKHWEALIDMFGSKEFDEIKSYAETLLSRCKNEVHELKDLGE